MWKVVEDTIPEELRADLEQKICAWITKRGVDEGRHFDSRSKTFFDASFSHSKLLRRLLDLPWTKTLIASRLTDPVLQHAYPLIKAPGGPPTTFHQDRAFWTEMDNPPSMFTLWCAITDVNESNGCLRMAYGENLLEHEEVLTKAGKTLQLIDQPDDASDIRMHAGQVLLFDSMQPHGAFSNNTKKHRLALKIVLGEKKSLGTSHYQSIQEIGRLTPVVRRRAVTLLRAAKSRITSPT